MSKIYQYHGKIKNLHLTVIKHDEDGKPMYQTNEDGHPIKDRETGRKIPITYVIKFSPVTSPAGKFTGESFYSLSEDHPQFKEIKKTLDSAVLNPFGDVMTMEDYRKESNPQAYAAEQASKALKEENSNLKSMAETLQAKLDAVLKGQGNQQNRR